MQFCGFEHSLALPFFGIGMKTELFQSCGHCWVFQICWHIESWDYFLRTACSWITASGVGLCRIPTNASLNWTDVYIYLMHNGKWYSQTLVILNMERKLTWWILCLHILKIFIEDLLFSHKMLCCQNILHYKFKFFCIISFILQRLNSVNWWS